uniref:glycerophosphodiester phosphodiesterase n=1 Tax=Anthurium amnicola TaxID=1678845 RepID=A0A1D1Y9T8_9ARAE
MREIGISRSSGKQHHRRLPRLSSRRLLRFVPVLVLLAVIPPVFFHFRLRRFRQMRWRKCGWLDDPPLVCAHGGDATRAAPNTMGAYHEALRHHVDCIEIDVSRSSDGVLFALHDRDLQRMTGNNTMKVGYLRSNEVQKTHCKNCLIWAKSNILVRDIIKLHQDVKVGYIMMRDSSTGAKNNLLRMKGADVVGVYHPLVEEELMRILHGRGKKVYAWTVDDEQSMRKMLFERVDAIVTGQPSLLQDLMQTMETQCLEEGLPLP